MGERLYCSYSSYLTAVNLLMYLSLLTSNAMSQIMGPSQTPVIFHTTAPAPNRALLSIVMIASTNYPWKRLTAWSGVFCGNLIESK